ncbi:MAG TPA: MFS transporter, partial [Bryobacteraceae bacterium]|nr:MFS transporter [Bryobacteraceae bacterium]
RMDPKITYYFGIAGMTVGSLILTAGPPPLIAIAAAALLGFGFSFPWSSVISTVLRQTPESQHGAAVGVLGAFYDLFVGCGSFAAGGVADRFGYGAAFLMAAVTLAMAGAAGIFMFPARRREIAVGESA